MNTLVFFISLLLGLILPIIIKKETKRKFKLKENILLCLFNGLITILLTFLVCSINKYPKDILSILKKKVSLS